MAELPDSVARGDFTMQDLSALCAKALDTKVVKYGFLMNGVEWTTLFALSNAFNARSYDRAADKLVLSEKEWMDYFDWWHGIINDQKIVPKGLPGMSGESITKILLKNESMVFEGYEGYRNMAVNSGMDARAFQAWFYDNYLMTLPPSGIKGRPATTMFKVFIMFISSKTSPEKIGYIKTAVQAMYAPDIQARTSTTNLSIPVTRNVLEEPGVKDIRFIGDMAKYVDVADAWASHPYYHQFLIHHKKAVERMLVEGSTAKEAYGKLKEELTYNVDKQYIVFTPK
jgi:hypothetical protein